MRSTDNGIKNLNKLVVIIWLDFEICELCKRRVLSGPADTFIIKKTDIICSYAKVRSDRQGSNRAVIIILVSVFLA